jgi:hexokinase
MRILSLTVCVGCVRATKEREKRKLISGHYLGGILRLVICKLIDDGVLFLEQNTFKLGISYALDTSLLSLMESDPTKELSMIIDIFNHFFALEITLAEHQFLRALAEFLSGDVLRGSAVLRRS